MRTFWTLLLAVAAMLAHLNPAVAQTTQDELRAALQHRFDTITPAIGELLPDLELYDADGNTVRLREVAGNGRYTVLVLGCLT